MKQGPVFLLQSISQDSQQETNFRNPGHWVICYKCVPRDQNEQAGKKLELEKPALSSLEFGQNLLNALLKPPWWTGSQIESVSQALAFVKVAELVAGKLLVSLQPGQEQILRVDRVANLHLKVVKINEDAQLP